MSLLIGCSWLPPIIIETSGCVDTFKFREGTKDWFRKVPKYAEPDLKADLDDLFKRECKLKSRCYPDEYDKVACEGENK